MKLRKDVIRRGAIWLLVLFVGLLPVLATGSRQVTLGSQLVAWFLRDRDSIMSSWSRPFAGEDASISTDGLAAIMIRTYGLGSYGITQAFQDQPGLYQGTVAAAWPATPAWKGVFRLRLVSEPEAPCQEVGRTEKVALDDCR